MLAKIYNYFNITVAASVTIRHTTGNNSNKKPTQPNDMKPNVRKKSTAFQDEKQNNMEKQQQQQWQREKKKTTMPVILLQFFQPW